MDQEQHASTGSQSTILVLDDCSPTRAIMTMNGIVKLPTSSVDTLKTNAQYLALLNSNAIIILNENGIRLLGIGRVARFDGLISCNDLVYGDHRVGVTTTLRTKRREPRRRRFYERGERGEGGGGGGGGGGGKGGRSNSCFYNYVVSMRLQFEIYRSTNRIERINEDDDDDEDDKDDEDSSEIAF
ncbi:hypothetical protein V1477_016905, partial [Vespula maculifrons]